MGSTRPKSSPAAPAGTCLPAADRQQTPTLGVRALLCLLWQTRSDASSGIFPGDSWADYGSVRLTGSESGRPGLTDLASSLPFAAALRHNSTNPLWSHLRFEPLEATEAPIANLRVLHLLRRDLRDAGEAFKQVEMLGKDWTIKHVTPSEFASNVDAGNAKGKTSFHDGQAILAVNFDGNTAHFDPNKACDAAWALWSSPQKSRASRLDLAVQGITTNSRSHYKGSLVIREGRLHIARGFDCKASFVLE
ncbi:hypothetical protein KC315_g76 [Hortaea werneckii]|nr:hypothetical protein KC315_g76 [Hortaea werneckii]